MKKIIKQFTIGIIAIIIGMIAIIKFIGDPQLIVGSFSLIFGITALIWIIKARKSLSKGSSLKSFTTTFLFILIFVLCYSLCDIITKLFLLEGTYDQIIMLHKYAFISFAYITFVGAAYKLRKIGKEFGFSMQVDEIKKVMKKKK